MIAIFKVEVAHNICTVKYVLNVFLIISLLLLVECNVFAATQNHACYKHESVGNITLKIFDGYLSIPSRYVVYPDSVLIDESERLRLVSEGGCKGDITIGDYKKYIELNGYPDDSKYNVEHLDNENFRILKIYPKDIKLHGTMPIYLITDGSQYILIYDQGESVWKKIVKSYRKPKSGAE